MINLFSYVFLITFNCPQDTYFKVSITERGEPLFDKTVKLTISQDDSSPQLWRGIIVAKYDRNKVSFEFFFDNDDIVRLKKNLVEIGAFVLPKNKQSIFDSGCYRTLTIKACINGTLYKNEIATSGYHFGKNGNFELAQKMASHKWESIFKTMHKQKKTFAEDHEIPISVMNIPFLYLYGEALVFADSSVRDFIMKKAHEP